MQSLWRWQRRIKMAETNRLVVDIEAIKFNIESLRKLIGDSRYYAVVKADAYGMGVNGIVGEIEEDVDGFCVSSSSEALELRTLGIDKDILVLGYIQADELELLAREKITVTIYDLNLAKQFDDVLLKENLRLQAHIKLDTGHGRLGFREDANFLSNILALKELKQIDFVGVFSHFATADEADVSYTKQQKDCFDRMLLKLRENGFSFDLLHLSNDAGFIKHHYNYDMVRSGISLYGIYPSNLLKEEQAVVLKPAFSWYSHISYIKDIKAGDSISYGRSFITDKNMRVATISIGYADGYKRTLSNKGYVLIHGKRAAILGNITMDQMMVDITDIHQAKVNDQVTLIGRNGDEYLSVEDLAKWADTISYEIMTSISQRVSRKYIK